MKTFSMAMIAMGLAGLLFVTPALAGDEAKTEAKPAEVKMQTTCPVMGGAINKDLYVDHDGKRIYVCCQGCVDAIKKDPAKYIKMMEEKGITLAQVPAEKTDDDATTEKAEAAKPMDKGMHHKHMHKDGATCPMHKTTDGDATKAGKHRMKQGCCGTCGGRKMKDKAAEKAEDMKEPAKEMKGAAPEAMKDMTEDKAGE